MPADFRKRKALRTRRSSSSFNASQQVGQSRTRKCPALGVLGAVTPVWDRLRTGWYMKPIFVLGCVLGAAPAWGQVLNTFGCTTSATVETVRIEGVTERPGDFVLTCTGGIPTPAGQPVPQMNVQFFFITDVTSRVLATGFSEALLLVDEPGSAANPVRRVCDSPSTGICGANGTGTGMGTYDGSAGRPNIYQARQTGVNSLVFLGVPIDPPGNGKFRTLRLTDVRLNANRLTPPTQVLAFVGLTGSTAVPINNPQLQVGVLGTGLTFGVTPKPALPQCTPQNLALWKSASANGVAQFSLTFAEGFPTSFRRRSIAPYLNANTSPAPVAQNVPATIWNTETGFFDPSFPTIVNRGNLGVAGLADQGTRLRAQFSGVPAGVKLYARAVITNGQLVARMVGTATDGSGAFSPVAANGFGIAPVPVNGSGVATLVYEILRSDPVVGETVTAPIYVAYGTSQPAVASVTVSGALAPLTTVLAADATAPIPRFVPVTPLPAFSIGACVCKEHDDDDEDDDDKGKKKSLSSKGSDDDCKKKDHE